MKPFNQEEHVVAHRWVLNGRFWFLFFFISAVLYLAHSALVPPASSPVRGGTSEEDREANPCGNPSYLSAELKQVRKRYQKNLPDSFRYRKASPFLVISNLSERRMEQITKQTVLRACKSFYSRLMDTPPDKVITVLLFKDEKSYRKWAKRLFQDRNVSHFGYFKSGQRVLVMNIATGTGTLVHEMTHALMDVDFPKAPAWFNEGMGSLYEQCRLKKNGPVGLKNWRLPGLLKAVKNDRLIDLKHLLTTERSTFYQHRTGLRYAEARYLMMYLQEKGVLFDYYHTFRKTYRTDPSGVRFLKQVLESDDLETIQENWVTWLKVRFKNTYSAVQ